METADRDIRPTEEDTSLHTMRNAVGGFETMVRLLKSGYRFDDAKGAMLLEELQHSTQAMRREIDVLERLLNRETDFR